MLNRLTKKLYFSMSKQFRKTMIIQIFVQRVQCFVKYIKIIIYYTLYDNICL